ncbi:hypothetical protein [Nonomuraea sp. LPB2021202275-12-8]|uniref:hypothetical protein n=1 Tax=Nonomuraea sp. LPB2021202275-12-8 TaxID=3120159 RepID=UPI00300CDFF8
MGAVEDGRPRVVRAAVLPSGDHTGAPVPSGAAVSAAGSPPSMGSRWICGRPSTGRR